MEKKVCVPYILRVYIISRQSTGLIMRVKQNLKEKSYHTKTLNHSVLRLRNTCDYRKL
jgi:hypothetical protein